LPQSAASARHFVGLVSEQSLYNLAVRTVELELIPALRALGIGLIPYRPLAAGLLAGALEAESKGRPPRTLQAPVEQSRSQLEAYESPCHDLGVAPAHVAVAWLLSNPVVSTAIVGPETHESYERASTPSPFT
jgi:aryl-alcohol dehydrogenase-like predicted oxidoreductase